jgi:hypothetical protein
LVLSSKRVFAVGSPSLGQPFSSRKINTCVAKYGIPTLTILAFDEVVEDREISNATRVVPMGVL